MNLIDFFKRFDTSKKLYPGEVVDLRKSYEISEEEAYDGIPCAYYDIYIHDSNIKVGSIDLRLKMDKTMLYFGHIGYYVIEKHRGHSYAFWACKILFEIAKKEYGLSYLILTCSPDNIASYKTLVRLNGRFLGIVDVPKNHELYMKNEKEKCIFRYIL